MKLLEFYKGKRVFITGHTGFKGSWLCRVLALAGAEIYGFSLPPETGPNLFSLSETEGLTSTVYGDIRDFEALSRALYDSKPEIVIHMAAQPLVRESYRDPKTTYETNVMGIVHLLEAIRQAGCPPQSVLNVTTDKVYEN